MQECSLLTEPFAVLGEEATQADREPALRCNCLEQDQLSLTPGTRVAAMHR